MAIFGFENYLLFIALFSSHLMIKTSQIKQYKLLGSIQSIKNFSDQKEGVLVLDYLVTEGIIIIMQLETTVKLLDK